MNKSCGTTAAATGRSGSDALLAGGKQQCHDSYGISAFRVHKEKGLTWRRTMAFVLQLAYLPLCGWILFSAPETAAFGVTLEEGNPVRNGLVFADIGIVMIAYTGKIFYIERQFMLLELFFVMPVLFPALVSFICVAARKNGRPTSAIDITALLIVVAGTFLNTWPELERARWKKRDENRGRLYTGGYFTYIRNPNYLGDVVWATGWAMASGSWTVAWIPVMVALVFVLMYIPEKESYLAKRYATDWPTYRYEARTVKLFPFIY